MHGIITHNDWWQANYIDYYTTELKFNYYKFNNTLNFKEACIDAAIKIKDRFPNKTINICYSGGVDSEALIRIFELADIDFQISTIKFYDKDILANEYDIKFVEKFITSKNLTHKHTYIDHTLNVREIVKYSEAGALSVGMLVQDIAINKNFSDPNIINVLGRIGSKVIDKTILSVYTGLFLENNTAIIVPFYWYTLELMNSYIKERRHNPISDEQYNFIQKIRDPNDSLNEDIYKIYMYVNYFGLKLRKSSNGLELWRDQQSTKKLVYWHSLPNNVKRNLRLKKEFNEEIELTNSYTRYHNFYEMLEWEMYPDKEISI